MCDSFFKGDLQTALELQREALPLVDALFSEVNPIPVKKAMNLMGMNVGPLRSLCARWVRIMQGSLLRS